MRCRILCVFFTFSLIFLSFFYILFSFFTISASPHSIIFFLFLSLLLLLLVQFSHVSSCLDYVPKLWERKHSSQLTSWFLHFLYLNSEFSAAHLHQTVDLVKSLPVVVVACRRTKPVTIFRPVLRERHWTSSDLPLHQDPTVDSQ